jgi:hypothetical protein
MGRNMPSQAEVKPEIQPRPDTTPSKGLRIITGPRSRLLEGFLFTSGILSACNGGGAITSGSPRSVDIPTFTPNPTLKSPDVTSSPVTSSKPSASPSETGTPPASPTPETTPTPEPTLISVTKGIIETPIEKISISTIKSNTEKLYKENVQAKTILSVEGANTEINISQNGQSFDKGNPNSIEADRIAAIEILVFKNYQIYESTGDPLALKLTQDWYWYGVNAYGQTFKNFTDPIITGLH